MLCWVLCCRAAIILLSTVPAAPAAAPPGISEAPNVLYHCQNQDEFFVSSGVSEGADDGGVGCGVLTSGTAPSGGGGVCADGGSCVGEAPELAVSRWAVPVAVPALCDGGGGVGGLLLAARGSDEYRLLRPSIACCDLSQYQSASSTGAFGSRPTEAVLGVVEARLVLGLVVEVEVEVVVAAEVHFLNCSDKLAKPPCGG